MTAEQKQLVQESFAKVVPIADHTVDLFYGRLFEIDPDLRPLFQSDLTEQKKKFMQMLGSAVWGLSDLDSLLPVVQALGERHGGYGAKDEHYDVVGEALLWALEQGLGDDFTPETKDAWVAVYGLLATTMKDATASSASV